jgi:hypothetical protein
MGAAWITRTPPSWRCPTIIESLLAEVAEYGTAHVKRAYGDWTGSSLKGWKEQLREQSIQPIQQFSYTTGKSATEAALVIDAMDLLFTERFDGFCIVSSDSDFTRLAARVRESGLMVYGFGERKTPKPFVAACDKFIYTETLTYSQSRSQSVGPLQRQKKASRPWDDALVRLLRNVVEAASSDEGWARLGAVGNLIDSLTSIPGVTADPKLMPLMEATGLFDVDKLDTGDGNPAVIYVRNLPHEDDAPSREPTDGAAPVSGPTRHNVTKVA